MKPFITIICACVPFHHTRRRLRRYLERVLNVQIKKCDISHVESKTKALVAQSKYFNKKYYLNQYPDVKDTGMDPLEHYLTIGYKLGYNPSSKFCTNFYLAKYPDVKKAEINPLVHYVMYGHREGRSVMGTPRLTVDYNKIKVESNSILLLSHEMSLTGAPIALIKIATVLIKRGVNVIILSPLHGELEQDLRKNNIPYIVDTELLLRLCYGDKKIQEFMGKFSYIFFNTIVALEFAPHIKATNKKIIWVHEGAVAYEYANIITDLKEAFKCIDEVYSVGAYSQGFTNKYIPTTKSQTLLYGIDEIKSAEKTHKSKKLRFGVFGACEQRKGQDLFVNAICELPAEIRKNCEFWIVGKTRKNDFYYNLKKLSRGLNVHFTGQLSHDDTMRKMVEMDVVVCPSLDDPMPIVCTEAAVLGKPVICSDQTGTAGFVENDINGFIYRLNKDNLSDILIKAYNSRDKLATMGQAWRKVYDDNFNMTVFEHNVAKIFNL